MSSLGTFLQGDDIYGEKTKHSRQKEWQGQRACGGKELGSFKELKRARGVEGLRRGFWGCGGKGQSRNDLQGSPPAGLAGSVRRWDSTSGAMRSRRKACKPGEL